MTTTIRERPLHFVGDDGSLVRAVLEGRKTAHCVPATDLNEALLDSLERHGIADCGVEAALKISRFQVGGILWVRESWAAHWNVCGNGLCVTGHAIPQKIGGVCVATDREPICVHYRSEPDHEKRPEHITWESSTSMPRWASRVTLEITRVDVMRLLDMKASDILALGLVERAHQCKYLGKCPVSAIDGAAYPDLVSVLGSWWKRLHGRKPGCRWEDNPWVWMVSWRRVEG